MSRLNPKKNRKEKREQAKMFGLKAQKVPV
jgi:hypothetical protein